MIFRRTDPTDRPSSAEPAEVTRATEAVEVTEAVDAAEAAAAVESGESAEVAERLAELARLQEERAALIELCLYARDRASSPAAAERVDSGLARLGIVALRPDGERFDPARHEAATGVPTGNETLHGTVAETEVPGYADRGRVVRPPVVAVYRRETP